MTIQERIDAALADGFEVVQEGRVLFPPDTPVPGGSPSARLTFQERVEGFDIHLLGHYGEPTWQSEFENRLFDDEQRWVHLRKKKAGASAAGD